jgi:hypothetical protein
MRFASQGGSILSSIWLWLISGVLVLAGGFFLLRDRLAPKVSAVKDAAVAAIADSTPSQVYPTTSTTPPPNTTQATAQPSSSPVPAYQRGSNLPTSGPEASLGLILAGVGVLAPAGQMALHSSRLKKAARTIDIISYERPHA